MTVKYRIEHGTNNRVLQDEHELDMLESLCEDAGRAYSVEAIDVSESSRGERNGSAGATAPSERKGGSDA